MKSILSLIVLPIGIVLFAGCAGRPPEPPMQQSLSQHPTNGYAAPIEQPNAEEQAGFLPRFAFSHPLHYRREIFANASAGWHQASGMDIGSDETYLPTDTPDFFIVKVFGKDPEIQRWNSHGCILTVTNTDPKRDVTMTVEDSGFLPQTPIKVGSTWDQHTMVKSSGSNFTFVADGTTHWKFVGMATIGSHRCAVLEGDSDEQRKKQNSKLNEDTDRAARMICYFDCRLGEIVEKVEITNANTAVSRAKSSHSKKSKSQGQNLLVLVE